MIVCVTVVFTILTYLKYFEGRIVYTEDGRSVSSEKRAIDIFNK